jgi:hypothetical protein
MKTGQTSSYPFPVTRSHLGRGDDDSLNRGSGAEIGLVALLRLHDVPRVLRHGGTTRLVPIMAEEKPDGAGARVFRDPRPGVEHERAPPFPGLERLQRDFQLVRWHDPRVQQSGVPPRDRDGPVAVRAVLVAEDLLQRPGRVQPGGVDERPDRVQRRRSVRDDGLDVAEVVQRRHRVRCEEPVGIIADVDLQKHAYVAHNRVSDGACYSRKYFTEMEVPCSIVKDEAGVYALIVIATVEPPVPVEVAVHDPGELGRGSVADREPAAAERHAVRVHRVLLRALRRRPDVVHVPVVVLAQHGHQVVREEHGVVVAHHKTTASRPSPRCRSPAPP